MRIQRFRFGSRRVPAALFALGALALACLACYVRLASGGPPRLRIGVTGSLESALVSYADASGAFRQHDLDVTIVQFPTAGDAVSAFEAGAVDGIVVANAALRQAGLEMGEELLPLSVSTGSDVVLAHQPVHSPNDLRGARFLVDTDPRSTWTLKLFLQRWGVSRQEVIVVSPSQPLLRAALQDEPFDFVITFAPTSLVVQTQTTLRPIFTSQESAHPVQTNLVVNRDLVGSSAVIRTRVRASLADCMHEYVRTPQPLNRYLASFCGVPLEIAAKCIDGQIKVLPSDSATAGTAPGSSRESRKI